MKASSDKENSRILKSGILECSICFECFDKVGPKTPRIVTSCGHTFCENCLTNHEMKNCPICSVPIQAEEFPKNFQLLDQIELSQFGETTTQDKSIIGKTSFLNQKFLYSSKLTLCARKLSATLSSRVYDEYHGILSQNILDSINYDIVLFKCYLKSTGSDPHLGNTKCIVGWASEHTDLHPSKDLRSVQILGVYINQYDCVNSIERGKFLPSLVHTHDIERSIESCWIKTIETGYNIKNGVIYIKLTDHKNKIVANRLLYSEVPNTVTLYPCVYLNNTSKLYDITASFNTPLIPM